MNNRGWLPLGVNSRMMNETLFKTTDVSRRCDSCYSSRMSRSCHWPTSSTSPDDSSYRLSTRIRARRGTHSDTWCRSRSRRRLRSRTDLAPASRPLPPVAGTSDTWPTAHRYSTGRRPKTKINTHKALIGEWWLHRWECKGLSKTWRKKLNDELRGSEKRGCVRVEETTRLSTCSCISLKARRDSSLRVIFFASLYFAKSTHRFSYKTKLI